MSSTSDASSTKGEKDTVATSKQSSLEPKVKAKTKAAPKKKAAVKVAPIFASKATKKGKAKKDDQEFEADEDDEEDDDDEAVHTEVEEQEDDDEEEDDEEDIVVNAKKPKGKGKQGNTLYSLGISSVKTAVLDDLDLPPISDLKAIFKDLVSNVQGDLVKICDTLNGRKLRVGTMCSGTESPLLALGLISDSLEELTGSKLEVEHIFSCEIEPFKQAYIERNFAPPLLFRDVTELGGDYALTAYGGRAAVPGGIDMLVAGTSCVDYSPLNTKKKGIDAQGESGRTFFGMLDYVAKHQPPIVILENVAGAPWDEVVKKFADIKYLAMHIKLDTKHYYIPHTRMRGYLIAVPQSTGGAATRAWGDKVKSLARAASSPLEAFLLPTDDPRIQRAREDLATLKETKDGVKRTTVDWIRCESRHAQAREQQGLGPGRPLTAWKDNGGSPTVLDGAWNDWASAQTERVLDLMDISALRLAKEGTDVSYKSALWNLSQNVDRTTASTKLGICPCLTPNMIPYLASRGGPVVGVEALALQGLPVDELLLTRESTDQLADLAGNAMSSTVVGAAILAALSVTKQTLLGPKAKIDAVGEGDVTMADPDVEPVNVEARIRGRDQLVDHPLDLASFAPPSADLLERADQSARKCVCEGRTGTSPLKTYTCTSCGHSSCESCRGRPEHNYVENTGARLAPDTFQSELKKMLPMRLSIEGFSLEAIRAKLAALTENEMPLAPELAPYCEAIAAAVDGVEFHFSGITRRKDWLATFSSDKAKLVFQITPIGCQWRLSVNADPELSVGSELRQQLSAPVARLRIAKGAASLLEGEWDLCVPLQMDEPPTLELETVGELVSSWKADLGLTHFAEEKRPAQVRIKSSPELAALIDRDIDGLYSLEKRCGTACNSLHRRVEPEEEDAMYLFFDPTRSGKPEEDSFVFADNCDRVEFGEHREIFASLVKTWRSPEDQGTSTLEATLATIWSPLPSSRVSHRQSAAADSTFATLSTSFDLIADKEACSFATNLLTATVKQAAPTAAVQWARPEWHEVDLQHEGPEVFNKVGWMLSKIPDWEAFREWQQVASKDLHLDCETCCPTAPTIKWYRKPGKVQKIYALEDGLQAAAFEKALKSRPSPLLVHTRQAGDSFEFRVGLNAATLAHKALGALPVHALDSFAASEPVVSWRLKSANGAELTLGRDGKQPTFKLPSNKEDAKAKQPPHFREVKLRPEQLRSLTWMLAQENSPTPWVEEETAEAILPQLGWHAEARATRNVSVRGGVLADEVGYGKTAITVGLISAQLGKTKLPKMTDRIPIKATLVVVPGHLLKQWPSEIAKFTKGADEELEVIVISTIAALKKITIEEFQDADIVVIAEAVFTSPQYWPMLGDWTASARGVKLDKAAGRYFRTCVNEALQALPEQLERLKKDNGVKAVFKAIQASREARAEASDIADEEQPSKRKKGAAVGPGKEAEGTVEAEGGEGAQKAAKPVKSKAEAKVDEDPWGLKTSTVRDDWKQMKSPPLSIFCFSRIVIDEFTYAEGAQLAAVHSIRSTSRWILSGTPPLRNFGEIKTIAKLLHVHLGVDDDGEGAVSARSASSKEKTAAEQFHSFRDVHTVRWHRRRDEVAQKFLDQYARQNLAEIDEIPYSEEVVKIDLPAAEMAIYRELEHHLLALSTDLGKIQKMKADQKGDREIRLSEALGESKTPEEALLKRCSHFSLDMDEETASLDNATRVCDMIVTKRIAQLQDCEEELVEVMRTAAAMHAHCIRHNYYFGAEGANGADVRHFKAHLKTIFVTKPKDAEAHAALLRIADSVGCEAGNVDRVPVRVKGTPKDMGEFLTPNVGANKIPETDYAKSRTWILRQKVSTLQRLTKELIGRYRSKRYFECVRNAQRNDGNSWDGVGILSSCGHTGPIDEVAAAASNFHCIDPTCLARVAPENIVLSDSLGVDSQSGTFGVKLETLVSLIKSETKKRDKILVFVQFNDLFDKVHEALGTYGISVAVLKGTASAKSTVLQNFQDVKNSSAQVLLLLVTDSSASGANLTVAQTALFVSPLLTDSRQQYKAFETQAIGRLRRYGQTGKVKVFRLLTASTLDVQVFEERAGVKVDDVIKTQKPRELSFVEHQKDAAFVLPKTARAEKAANTKAKKIAAKASAVAKGSKGRSKAAKQASPSSEESEAESSAADSDSDAPKTRKRPVKPVAANGKGKGKVVEDSDDSDKEPVAKKSKPAPKKVELKRKAAVLNSDSDDEPVVSPKKRARPAIIDSDSDDDDDKPSATAPSASTSKVTTTKAPASTVSTASKKAGPSNSSSKATPSSSKSKTSTSTSAQAQGSPNRVFVGVVVPSNKPVGPRKSLTDWLVKASPKPKPQG